MKIVIADYGIGNLGSIRNMFKRIGVDAVISGDPGLIREADKLLLPGVGHFDYCMEQLKKSTFYELLNQRVLDEKVPVMGVCVGCQMLMESSEEGTEKGLGWLKGKVVRFRSEDLPAALKIPHMGWADVQPKGDDILYKGIDEPRFYFVHSYHLICDEPVDETGVARYGYDFTVSVQKENISGVQFHPEKSHKFGMKLYENFARNIQ